MTRLRDDLDGASRSLLLLLAVRIVVLVTVLLAIDVAARAPYEVLTRWDSQWYGGIAEHGYGTVRIAAGGRRLTDYAFFPLYPLLERLGAALTEVAVLRVGFAISVLASVVGALGIHAIATRLYGARVGVVTVALWSVYPAAAVLWLPYSEALFVALAAWSLYALLVGAPVTAAALAALAGLTRPTGVAVAAAVMVVVTVDLVRAARSGGVRRRPGVGARVVALVVAPLGTATYLLWVAQRTGEPSGYFHLANGWGNGLDGGRAFAVWTADQIGQAPYWPGLLVVLGVAALAALAVACVRQRQPTALLVYSLTLLALAFGTSGYFGSKPRYLLPAFPLLLPLARWVADLPLRVRAGMLVVGGMATAAYACFWLLGPGPL